jgi:hypothetical protein
MDFSSGCNRVCCFSRDSGRRVAWPLHPITVKLAEAILFTIDKMSLLCNPHGVAAEHLEVREIPPVAPTGR